MLVNGRSSQNHLYKVPKKKNIEGRLIEMVFRRLHYLRLIDLPKLMGFAVGIHYVNSPLEF